MPAVALAKVGVLYHMKKISVHLVSWNGAKYIPHLFDSLRKQTYTDWQLIILDNNSQDGTVERIERELVNFPFEHRFIKLKENIGFAGGHNKLYAGTNTPYILPLNQDMYLESHVLEKLAGYMEAHPGVAAVSPRLMRWDFQDIERVGLEKSFSSYVDSFGLEIWRNRRVIEKYAQQEWKEVQQKIGNTEAVEVFGVSGAFPLLRRSALKQVELPDGTFFDASYHAYKEDVDLAFRLRGAGFSAFILTDAVAHHDRSAARPKQLDDVTAGKNKKLQSEWVKYHSYKNHLMTIYKNEDWRNITLDFPWILWYELKKFAWYLLFDQKILKGLLEMWKLRKELYKKRKVIKIQKKVNWKYIRSWYAR